MELEGRAKLALILLAALLPALLPGASLPSAHAASVAVVGAGVGGAVAAHHLGSLLGASTANLSITM